MALVASPSIDECRISRRITINIDQKEVNVRPVIKGAIEEAAHTLADAFGSLHYDRICTHFKEMINTASLQSRDFAVQVEGCKGVLVWTNHQSGFAPPVSAKPSNFIKQLCSNITKFQLSCDKVRRKVMSDYDSYITIGYIGILPQEQRKGLGSALLHYVTDKADEAQLPICAQVSNGGAVRFFEKFGFKIEGTIKGDLPTCIMVREPVSPADLQEPRPLRIRPGRRNSDH